MAKHQLYFIAVDGSEWGNRAADQAVRLAKQTGATVRLITVIPWSGFQPMPLEEIMTRPLVKNEEEKRVQEKVLAPIMEKHADSGVTIESEIHWGHPVKVIHEAAKTEKVSMIFVGRRGRSRVADVVLGSVANALAHTIHVPIVLVP